MDYSAYGHTDIGREREGNEDSFLINEELGLFIVADGMGGLDNGAGASEFAVNRLAELIGAGADDIVKFDVQKLRNFIADAVNTVSEEIKTEIGRYSGTTLVFLLMSGSRAFIANVGDSPAYLFRQGVVKQLSRDHNVAQELYNAHKLSLSQLKSHSSRNRLTAYIGMDDYPPVYISELTPAPGDRMLLCSDGLTCMIGEAEISQLLGSMGNIEETANKLIERSNSEGGLDNITVILVDFN